MKVSVRTATGEVVDFDDVDAAEPLGTLKCLIESVKPDLGPMDSLQLSLADGTPVGDDSSLTDVGYKEGDVLLVGRADAPMAEEEPPAGAARMPAGLAICGRPGPVPTTGFQAVEIVVSKCTNEKTNGLYAPAAPHNGKPVWAKAASEEVAVEGEEPKSKDKGERAIFFSEKGSRWYISDSLEDSGFTFVHSWGQCFMPPAGGWQNGAAVEYRSSVPDGDLDAAAALGELARLGEAEWEGQEVCYATMLKVLGNIAANPGEAKFCSLKLDNAAIQKKIMNFNGARGFLEAVGFRENSGALVLPTERHAQAKLAQEMLQGYATEANYNHIRKERHAKAAEEAKKEAARPKRYAPTAADAGEGGGGSRFGRGPQRGGG